MKLELSNDKLVFNAEQHCYTFNGNTLKSVTQIMQDNNLAPDYSGASEAVLNKRAEYGTAIHKEIELESADSEAYKQFLTLTESVGKCEYHEAMVSDYNTLAGTIDCIFSDGSIGDVKTSTTLHNSAVQWQLSIYKYLLEKLNPDLHVPHLYAIHLPQGKPGKLVEFKPIPQSEILDLIAFDGFYVWNPNLLPVADVNSAMRLLAELNEKRAIVKQLEAELKAFDERLMLAMQENGIQKWQTETATYTLVSASERRSVDSAKLQTAYPEIYADCLKTTTTKPYLKTTLRNGK